jgi:pimeloyl-ACP methyl ester carboxylesterase
MHSAQLTWTWRGKTIDLGFDTSGQGPTVLLLLLLLLPALSSISTRREMWPLQERLSSQYRTVAVDWPGFGDQARPAVDWKPAAYAAFLEYILETVAPSPHAVIAAGHAAARARLRPARLAGKARSGGTDLARALADNDEWTPAVL